MKFCKKCDTETERYATGKCKLCAKVSRAVRYAASPEKEKARVAAWQAANRDKVRASTDAWKAANRERVKASTAAWHAANCENGKAVSAAWRAANPDKVKANNAAWREANSAASRVHKHNRRARKLEVGGKLSSGFTAKLFRLQKGKCACGCKQPLGADYHRDHIMPLALGGTNTDDNMQLLRKLCNLQKHAKHPIDFMQSRGFLL